MFAARRVGLQVRLDVDAARAMQVYVVEGRGGQRDVLTKTGHTQAVKRLALLEPLHDLCERPKQQARQHAWHV